MTVSLSKHRQITPSSEAQAQRDQKDRELIERIASARDHTAMEAFYVQYRPRLSGFLRRLTYDNSLIEEAYNDVMLKVWHKAHQYQGQSKVSSWVFSIAYRTCLRMVKKQQSRQSVLDTLGQSDLPSSASLHEATEQADLIDSALARLSAKHRLVIELSYFSGYSTEEVGQIVQCPTNTVKTRLHHARKKIRTFVEETTKK
ncbi:MAG: RNA polymerase sigma factor [Gammaproteobacteria bacterium]|nr:RNA polymerase sigma factor [Gammaproteobacteria bacterium]